MARKRRMKFNVFDKPCAYASSLELCHGENRRLLARKRKSKTKNENKDSSPAGHRYLAVEYACDRIAVFRTCLHQTRLSCCLSVRCRGVSSFLLLALLTPPTPCAWGRKQGWRGASAAQLHQAGTLTLQVLPNHAASVAQSYCNCSPIAHQVKPNHDAIGLQLQYDWATLAIVPLLLPAPSPLYRCKRVQATKFACTLHASVFQ